LPVTKNNSHVAERLRRKLLSWYRKYNQMSDIELRRRCRAEHFTFDGYSFDLLLNSPFSGDEKALMEAQVGALQIEVLGDCTLGGGSKTLEEAKKRRMWGTWSV